MDFINIRKKPIEMENIPAIVLRPDVEKENYPTVVFYHGWGSSKERQLFRGSVIASLGFQVILPDAIHHGARGPIDYSEHENTGLFWEVVLNNLQEWEAIKKYAVDKLQADQDRIGVAGHSMGGFTASGIFADDGGVKTCAILNGSFSWMASNEIFKETLRIEMTEGYRQLEKRVLGKDPSHKAKSLVDRRILILHGEADSMVDIAPQREFFEMIKDQYSIPENIRMTSFQKLDHYVTTNMLEEMCKWFVDKLMEG